MLPDSNLKEMRLSSRGLEWFEAEDGNAAHAAAVAIYMMSEEHRLRNEHMLQLPRHAAPLSLPLLNTRAQVMVWDKLEICTSSERMPVR